jgi:hypothetical protein
VSLPDLHAADIVHTENVLEGANSERSMRRTCRINLPPFFNTIYEVQCRRQRVLLELWNQNDVMLSECRMPGRYKKYMQNFDRTTKENRLFYRPQRDTITLKLILKTW